MWYAFVLAIGILLLGISLYLFKNSLQFLHTTERATGTVVEIRRVSGSDGDTFKPVFKFRTISGEDVLFERSSSSNPPGWEIGDEGLIAYDASLPSKARLVTYFGVFSWTIVLMAIAMPMIVVGGGYYVAQHFLK